MSGQADTAGERRSLPRLRLTAPHLWIVDQGVTTPFLGFIRECTGVYHAGADWSAHNFLHSAMCGFDRLVVAETASHARVDELCELIPRFSHGLSVAVNRLVLLTADPPLLNSTELHRAGFAMRQP